MKSTHRLQKVAGQFISRQLPVLCVMALTAEAASARIAMGMPDSSMMPIWGSMAVLGVIGYRLKRRK